MPASIPVTDLTICQAALTLIGMPAIINLTETGDSEAMCNLHYPLLKRSVLSGYNWPWTTKHARLAIDATAVPLTQYTNAFQLPPDRLDDDPLLTLLGTEEGLPPFKDYEIQDEHLLTNQGTIYIWYLSKDGELEKKWPEYFIDFMIHALAARLAMPLTERVDLFTLYDDIAWGDSRTRHIPGGMYAKARARSFQDKPPIKFESFELILARLGGL